MRKGLVLAELSTGRQRPVEGAEHDRVDDASEGVELALQRAKGLVDAYPFTA